MTAAKIAAIVLGSIALVATIVGLIGVLVLRDNPASSYFLRISFGGAALSIAACTYGLLAGEV